MEKSSQNQRKRRSVYEISIIAFSIFTLGIAMLVDGKMLPIPQILVMKITSLEDYLFTLFSIQASSATLGIAIVTIITGVTNDSHLGISITEFITSINPTFLKHKRMLVTSLLMIIINYIATSFMWINTCIAIFVISIVINICLVLDVYIIFKGSKKLHQDIATYLVEHHDNSRLSHLRDELISAIETGNILTMESSVAALKSIFEYEARTEPLCPSTIDQITNIIIEAFKKAVRRHDSIQTKEMLRFVLNIYSIANKDTIRPISLWEHIFRDYYKALSNLPGEQISEEFSFYLLHEELYKNILAKHHDTTDNDFLKFFSAWTYNALLSSESNWNSHTRTGIKRRIYEMTTLDLLYGHNSLSQSEIILRRKELCYLIKTAIDSGDTELIENYFLTSCENHERDENLNFALVVILIYLYYLAARETITSGKETQDFAREILRRNRESLSYFFFTLDIVKIAEDHKKCIDNMLWTWEQIDSGDVKTSIIQSAVDDFFLFSVCAEGWDKDRISRMVDVIAPAEIYPIYTRFLSESLRDNTIVLFGEYCKLFAEGEYVDQSFHDKLLIMEELLNEKYHDQAMRKAGDSLISEEQQQAYSQELCSVFHNFLDNTFSYFQTNRENSVEYPLLHNPDCVLLNMYLSNSLIKNKRMYSNLSERMSQQIMRIFLHCIHNHVDFQEKDSDCRSIQQCLIEMVAATGITPTHAIGHKDTFWKEENPKLLKNYTEELEHIKFPGGYNTYYIIDGTKVQFHVGNIRVVYTDVSEDSVLKRCHKKEDGKFYYNITNDILIPFQENEIINYVQSTEKIITVKADISYRVLSKKIGAGIQIVPKK